MAAEKNDGSETGRAGWRGWFARFRGSRPVRTLSTLAQVQWRIQLVCNMFGVDVPWQGDEVSPPVWAVLLAVWDVVGPWVHGAVDLLIALLQLFYG
ncbi:hypothetical protein SRABI91_05406 [Rhodococcoides fascians]|nr:hypothetical protein SRABI91_05406 [Rhodococcus fascians]